MTTAPSNAANLAENEALQQRRRRLHALLDNHKESVWDRYGKIITVCGGLFTLVVSPLAAYVWGTNAAITAAATKQQTDAVRYDTLIQERGPQNAATRTQVDELRVTVAVVKAQAERTQADVNEMRGDIKTLLQRSANQ